MIVVLAFLGIRYITDYGGPAGHAPRVDPSAAELNYVVERVIDGDTLLLVSNERVRLIGVDTPETVQQGHPVEPYGPEASQFTTQMVEGKSIRLKFDKERRDRYGRLLAYVYVDGLFLNEELIRRGYSKAQLQYPYSNATKRLFYEAEEDAKAAKRGIWSLPAQEENFERRSAA